MKLKSLIPSSFRLKIRVFQRKVNDFRQKVPFAKHDDNPLEMPFCVQVEQPISQSHLFENKIHDLRLAANRIEKIHLEPNQVFSFWNAVGVPDKGNGFKKGRNLIGGVLTESYGGGLCQMAGVLYHLSLLSGLRIEERHNHSVDIYQDHGRYTPLEADATVVYGTKDFRCANPFPFPICFSFEISTEKLTAKLLSTQPIPQKSITFIRSFKNNKIIVKTISHNSVIAISECKKQSS